LLGRPFAEATLFRLAHAYERAHAWSSLSPPRTAYALAG
jgi:Asp-tRNA(Asn)/Glu-tRNA(Gln) amidotransferase A subunit family amidase